jgi:hypothetical protein
MTGVSVSVAAIYYMFTLRINMRIQQLTLKAQEQSVETRQAQLFMQSFNLWITSGLIDKYIELMNQQWKDYNEWAEKYGPKTNPEGALVYARLDTFFEGIGTLVKKKLVDPWLVDEFMGSDVIRYWKKMRPIAEGTRKLDGWETWAENSEYLYDEVVKIYREQHPEIII